MTRVSFPDHASVQLKNHFADASAFIRRAESHGGRILVHCVAGASRSVAYVLMHLISVHRIRLEDAWNHVLKLRCGRLLYVYQ
jgi:protein-tyrosine phosphatase